MDKIYALATLGALSQETRLEAFRLLIKKAPEGLPAGEIASTLGVVQNTMSAHLSVLAQSGLVTTMRKGRTINYAANFSRVRELLLFLMQDCCQGAPEICEPLFEVVSCSSPERKTS